jgi:hypothetical protein
MATRMFNACEHFINIITFTLNGKRCILVTGTINQTQQCSLLARRSHEQNRD